MTDVGLKSHTLQLDRNIWLAQMEHGRCWVYMSWDQTIHQEEWVTYWHGPIKTCLAHTPIPKGQASISLSSRSFTEHDFQPRNINILFKPWKRSNSTQYLLRVKFDVILINGLTLGCPPIWCHPDSTSMAFPLLFAREPPVILLSFRPSLRLSRSLHREHHNYLPLHRERYSWASRTLSMTSKNTRKKEEALHDLEFENSNPKHLYKFKLTSVFW